MPLTGQLREHLPGKHIPVTVKERRTQLLRQRQQVSGVLRVVVRVVLELGRDEPRRPAPLIGIDPLTVVRGRDVPLLHRPVAAPARVRRAPNAQHRDIRAARPQARLQGRNHVRRRGRRRWSLTARAARLPSPGGCGPAARSFTKHTPGRLVPGKRAAGPGRWPSRKAKMQASRLSRGAALPAFSGAPARLPREHEANAQVDIIAP
jgi:hypothetical protein